MRYKFNKPYYEIRLSEIDDEVHVFSFEGNEEISNIYEYHISLVSPNPSLDSSKILNNKATFIINRGDDEPQKINGIISSFHQRGSTRDYFFYDIVLVPRMWLLLLNHRSAVYQHMNIEDIVTRILKDAGFAGEDFEFRLENSYSELEYVVQYRETDFQFINRRLEHFGIFYFFAQVDDKDVIVFADSNDAFESIDSEGPIPYKPHKDPLSEVEAIHDVYSDERVVTGLVRLKDYDYEHPEKQLIAESHLDSDAPGTYYEYGDNFKTDQEGEFLARIRNEEILCRSKIISGTSDCRLIRSGNTIEMDGHYRDDWNGEYIITNVSHRGNQRGLFGLLQSSRDVARTYENTFESIPSDITYRPRRKTPSPRLYGVLTAKVDSEAGEQYAYIDDLGRYKLKFPFDLSDNSDGNASKPVRMVQTYSGPNYGIHFPNHKDTEAIWGCMDGDPDRPVIIGTVPNTANVSPSKSDNKMQSVIRTAGENEITLDDSEGNENIYMHATKDHTIKIKNDKIEEIDNDYKLKAKNYEIEVEDFKIIVTGHNTYDLKVVGNAIYEFGRDYAEKVYGHVQKNFLKTVKENFQGDIFKFDGGFKNEVFVGGKNEVFLGEAVSAKFGVIIETGMARKIEKYIKPVLSDYLTKKSLKCGHYQLDSAGDVTIEGGTQIVIDIGSSTLVMNPNGNIVVKGKKITFDGDVEISKNLEVKGNLKGGKKIDWPPQIKAT